MNVFQNHRVKSFIVWSHDNNNNNNNINTNTNKMIIMMMIIGIIKMILYFNRVIQSAKIELLSREAL